MSPSSLLQRARRRVTRLRTALTESDAVPGLRRLVRDLVRVEVVDRSMVVAAQAMLALVPLLIVLGSFLPAELGQLLLERFSGVTGVAADSARAARRVLTTDQVRTETGVAGLLLTLVSATSFARAVQRLLERIWEQPHVGGLTGARWCFVWLSAWVVLLPVVGLVGTLAAGWAPWGLGTRVVQALLSTLVWWWSARVLLLGRETWRRLLPGALLTGVALVLYSTGSGLVMPRYAAQSVDQLGTLGLVLAVTTWLIGFGFTLTVAGVLGRVLVVDDDVHRALRALRLAHTGRAAGGLTDRQHQRHDHH